MKTFSYTATDKDWALKRGVLQAEDRIAALAELRKRGLTPVSVTEGRAPRAAPHGDRADGAAQGLGQSDHNLAFDIPPPRRRRRSLLKRRARAKSPARTAGPVSEQLLEEIAEAGPAKIEFERLPTHPAGAEPATTLKRFPAGRRTELGARLPVRAQLIVFFPLGGIAQDFVGLVDLLEFFLRAFLVFGDVGMVFAGELAERLFDVGIAGAARNAQGLIVIFELNRHTWLI